MCISQTSTGERADNKWKATLVIAPDENAVKYDDCYLPLSVVLHVKMRTEIYMSDFERLKESWKHSVGTQKEKVRDGGLMWSVFVTFTG